MNKAEALKQVETRLKACETYLAKLKKKNSTTMQKKQANK